MAEVIVQTAAEEQGLGQVARVVDTFVVPSETFRDIRRNASWWLPFLIMALASFAFAYTVERKVGFDQVVQNIIHASPSQESQLNALDPAVRAQRLQAMAKGYRYTSYAFPIMTLLFALFGSLVLWVSFNFGLGARSTYPQILALWMYAALPRLLVVLVAIVTLWFGGSPENFNLQQPAGTNLGYYLTDAAPWLRTLLSFFDVASLWSVVLLILGGAIVARVKTAQAAAVVIGWWVLILIVSVASTAAFS